MTTFTATSVTPTKGKIMKIVILDGWTENPGDLSWKEIEELGDVTIYDRTPSDDDEIKRRLDGAVIAVTNKTPLDRAVIEGCPKLKYITVLATGYNVVDTAAAGERGIAVSNVPSYGTDSVAQAAVALLLELCHHMGHHSNEVHGGRWGRCPDFCFWDYPLVELRNKTMGIIGFGRIGHRTAEIARALGMNVIVSSRKSGNDGYEYVPKEELFRRSDVIVLHCPMTGETEGLINRETISLMKDGVLIVNNSRGGLVVEKDLAEALSSGKVGGAAVDVVSSEPIKADNPLLSAPNCIITPHLSWGAREARERIMMTTADNIRSFLRGKPQNVVNSLHLC